MFRQSLRSVARVARVNQMRSYAEAVNPDVLKLSLAMPHEAVFSNKEVTQVNLPALSGDIGILANHVPIVEQLRPGLIEIVEGGSTKNYFVSGGVAVVQPGSKLSVTAIEAFTPESFSLDAIKSQIAEAQKNVSSSDEAVSAEAEIELEVLEALQHVAK